uniref:Uncharacterized protein n=2 Tax=Gasterosteus aculeatus TaxID=69293 RepID=G3Q8R4_GASAC
MSKVTTDLSAANCYVMDLGSGVGDRERERERGREIERGRLLHHLVTPVPASACISARLLFSGSVSECASRSDLQPLLHARQLVRHRTKRTQPVFILEGKAPVDGGGGEAASLVPAALPLTQAESPGPWQSESLLAESWSTMGDADPDDTKSLDSNDGALLGGEENHSHNSDMVHLEREEAEMLEEAERARRTEEEEEEDDEELRTSALSVLGGEGELVELSEEEQDLRAPETEELLVSAEEPRVEKKPAEFMQVVPPMALPPLPIVKLDPPSTTSTPVPSTAGSEAEELYAARGLQPPSILAQVAADPPSGRPLRLSQIPLSDAE